MAKLIEKVHRKGSYDIDVTIAIIETAAQERVLLTEGYGGDDLNGYTYRWDHGMAVKLLPNDTLEQIQTAGINNILRGDDTARPVLDWPGYAVRKTAESVGL